MKPREAVDGLVGLEDFRKQLSKCPTAPIILWAAPIWSERCHLWWTLDALGALGIPRERLWLAEPRGRLAGLGLGACSPENLRAVYDDCVPLSAEMAEEGSALWRAFASSSPLEFDQARLRGSKAFPELGSIGEAHLAWFPWHKSDRLRLSDADALLLGSFGADWHTPIAMVRGPNQRKIVYELMSWVGDGSLLDRLDAWRSVGVVEREERDGQGWASFALRLTERGLKLCAEGATQITELAPLGIGGCRVNDPAAPFVRVADDAGSHLAPLS